MLNRCFSIRYLAVRCLAVSCLAVLSAASLVAGCTRPAEEDQPAAEAIILDLGTQRFEWSAVDGAVEYRVQLWSEMRLLFEELREQPFLELTPAMRRSLLGVEVAELQVRAYAADGLVIGSLHRQRFPTPTE